MKTAFWKADWFLGLVIAIVLSASRACRDSFPASSAGPTTSA